jgi:hypothetical protein
MYILELLVAGVHHESQTGRLCYGLRQAKHSNFNLSASRYLKA